MFVGRFSRGDVDFLWHDLEMASREKVFINQLTWENKLLHTEIKEMQEIKDIMIEMVKNRTR